MFAFAFQCLALLNEPLHHEDRTQGRVMNFCLLITWQPQAMALTDVWRRMVNHVIHSLVDKDIQPAPAKKRRISIVSVDSDHLSHFRGKSREAQAITSSPSSLMLGGPRPIATASAAEVCNIRSSFRGRVGQKDTFENALAACSGEHSMRRGPCQFFRVAGSTL